MDYPPQSFLQLFIWRQVISNKAYPIRHRTCIAFTAPAPRAAQQAKVGYFTLFLHSITFALYPWQLLSSQGSLIGGMIWTFIHSGSVWWSVFTLTFIIGHQVLSSALAMCISFFLPLPDLSQNPGAVSQMRMSSQKYMVWFFSKILRIFC